MLKVIIKRDNQEIYRRYYAEKWSDDDVIMDTKNYARITLGLKLKELSFEAIRY